MFISINPLGSQLSQLNPTLKDSDLSQLSQSFLYSLDLKPQHSKDTESLLQPPEFKGSILENLRVHAPKEGFIFGKKQPPFRYLERIPNAHQDDINCLKWFNEKNYLLSGSKDCQAKIWDIANKTQRSVHLGPSDYTGWVTAITTLSDHLWTFGTRDGRLITCNQEGNVDSQFNYESQSHFLSTCKERNLRRVNCISAVSEGIFNGLLMIGRPSCVDIFNPHTNAIQHSIKAHASDWVYCIEPLRDNSFLIVIGSKLEQWNFDDQGNIQKQVLVELHAKKGNKQKPFISFLTPLNDQKTKFIFCSFDGGLSIIDIACGKIETQSKTHEGRIWSVIPKFGNCYLSAADDHTVKLWDHRSKRLEGKIEGFHGRVSNLLNADDTMFITASCPDDITKSAEKASIAFWDIKKVELILKLYSYLINKILMNFKYKTFN